MSNRVLLLLAVIVALFLFAPVTAGHLLTSAITAVTTIWHALSLH